MKKKNADVSSSIKLDRIDDSWEENQIVQWITKYGFPALLALLAGIALVFIIFRLITLGNEEAEMEYWNADKEFAQFSNPSTLESDPLAGEDALARLNAILNRQPELHAKYDGLIAQTLIGRNDIGDALPFAKSALNRTETENTPYYTSYAQTTLLIGESHYEDALNLAVLLDKQMREALNQNLPIEQRHFGDLLFSFNLLRIGILQEKLGLKDQELHTWQEWKRYQQGTEAPTLAKAFQQQNIFLSEGKVTFADYIDYRIQRLLGIK